MANIHHPIPRATKYEINEFGAIRNIKYRSPVFENSADEIWLKSDTGELIQVYPKELVKQLFNKDLKNAPLNKFQKEQLKQQSIMKKKEVKAKTERVKVEKPTATKEKKAKETTVSTVNPSIKEGVEIEFAPRWKKHRQEEEPKVKGVVTKVFKGGDGNEYAKIRVETKVGDNTEVKTYLKQTKSL